MVNVDCLLTQEQTGIMLVIDRVSIDIMLHFEAGYR